MSSTQFWIGMLVPPIIKWASPIIKKYFKLTEFDPQTKERITAKKYPFYFSVLYTLWILCFLGSGIAVLLLMMIYGPTILPQKNYGVSVLIGLINMIGAWCIFGAIIYLTLWQISPNNFRDYIMYRQLKSGWGYDMKQQIATMFKIGIIYYIIFLPITILLLFV